MTALRLLVLDAYAPEGRSALRDAGGTEAGELYRRMFESFAPNLGVDLDIEVAHPADPDPELPEERELAHYDGVAWTGSSLTIHHDDDPRVARQVAFARAVFRSDVPSFGSCWAAQLAVVAGGGSCAPSPRGREFGISRRIALSEAGRAHPLFAGKPGVFQAFTSHRDEVVTLARGATLLASNPWSEVQAVDVANEVGRFWAVQYHPEYDLHEVASLCRLRADELVRQGMFVDIAAAHDYIAQLEALHQDPTRRDLADALEIEAELLTPEIRTLEARNWLRALAEPAD